MIASLATFGTFVVALMADPETIKYEGSIPFGLGVLTVTVFVNSIMHARILKEKSKLDPESKRLFLIRFGLTLCFYFCVITSFFTFIEKGRPEAEQVKHMLGLSIFVDVIIPGIKAFVERKIYLELKDYFIAVKDVARKNVECVLNIPKMRTSSKIYNLPV